jgi:hypothetical protein
VTFGTEDGLAMKHFFFDLTTTDQSMYDYRGDAFSSSQSAIEFAQEAATLLKHSLSNDWTGWSLEVRNAEGKKFFSMPVKTDLVDAVV